MRVTATEMYDTAAKLVKPTLEKEYNSIIEAIHEAAMEGRFSCKIKNIHSLNIQRLEEDGFSVRLIDCEFSPYFYLIEWYNPKGKREIWDDRLGVVIV